MAAWQLWLCRARWLCKVGCRSLLTEKLSARLVLAAIHRKKMKALPKLALTTQSKQSKEAGNERAKPSEQVEGRIFNRDRGGIVLRSGGECPKCDAACEDFGGCSGRDASRNDRSRHR